MSRFKLFGFIALITLAFGIALVGDALAGEKYKSRTAYYNTKWEQIEVGDQEGHVLAVGEGVGIVTLLEDGIPTTDGAVERTAGLYDLNLKTGTLSARGYSTVTDRDGDKTFSVWEGKMVGQPGKARGEGTFKYVGGTGKYQGIKGGGTWVSHRITPTQRYSDVQGEYELPQ